MEATETLFVVHEPREYVSFEDTKEEVLPEGVLFQVEEIYPEPDSEENDEKKIKKLQEKEEREMDIADPSFKEKLEELDRKLKKIEDPDEAWYIIETSFLRDYGDKENEQRILDFEIAHGIKVLAVV